MKNIISYTFGALAMTMALTGCHDPKELTSNGDPNGIISINAKFVNDESTENLFAGDIDHTNHTINFRVPMYYPKASFNELSADDIKNMRITAALSNNSTIEPALTTLDLTKTNYITIKNPNGVKTRYTVTGQIVPLWDCDIDELELADGTSGIVDEANHVITLIATDDLEPQTAKVTFSPHATLSPDITTTPFDFNDENATLTVIAQNGVDKKEYRFVLGEPARIPFGIREGSEQLRWVKRWDEIGYTLKDKQTGFGVTDKYLILNEVGNMHAVVVKASNGTDTGMRLDMSIIPDGKNHNMTSDNAGNIIVNSKYDAGNDPSFKLWVFKGIDDKGTLLINQSVYGAGDRVSVYGDITKDAIIITPLSGTQLQACRWVVKDGIVGPSQVISFSGLSGNPPYANCDFAPTSATNTNADIYAVFYGTVNNTRGPVSFYSTGAVKAVGYPNTKKRDEADGGVSDAGNWIMSACDYVEFNKNKYLAHNSVNTFSWGANDYIYLLDVSGGALTNELYKCNTHGAIAMLTDGLDGIYGAKAAGNIGMAGNCSDVRLWVSDSGFYMYTYFMFTNGYMGCIRVDCIKR